MPSAEEIRALRKQVEGDSRAEELERAGAPEWAVELADTIDRLDSRVAAAEMRKAERERQARETLTTRVRSLVERVRTIEEAL
jgi:hypothetical protein